MGLFETDRFRVVEHRGNTQYILRSYLSHESAIFYTSHLDYIKGRKYFIESTLHNIQVPYFCRKEHLKIWKHALKNPDLYRP